MTLSRLDHFTIRCNDLAQSRAFYVEVLGLKDGERPPFPFPGAWLYLDGRPVVHLVGGSHAERSPSTGSLDHVAFAGEDIATTRKRINERAIAFEERAVPGTKITQLFLKDPDGVQIELNFAER